MLKAWLHKLFKSQYVTYLEAELERTRTELRRWQDSALIREGLPPLTPREATKLPRMSGKPLPSQHIRHMQNLTLPRDEKTQA